MGPRQDLPKDLPKMVQVTFTDREMIALATMGCFGSMIMADVDPRSIAVAAEMLSPRPVEDAFLDAMDKLSEALKAIGHPSVITRDTIAWGEES